MGWAGCQNEVLMKATNGEMRPTTARVFRSVGRDAAESGGPLYCGNCGHPNAGNAIYCAKCGSMLNLPE
jgi:zinc-ribbon domain